MPPLDQWYAGREAIRSFFQWAFRLYADFRLVPIRANRQPAFAAYSRARAGGQWTAHSIQVLTLQGGSISRLTLFAKPDSPGLFEAFRLPLTLEDGNEYRRESTPES
jgi:RNA polymerase sigma-70 factor (ECF subfamily)